MYVTLSVGPLATVRKQQVAGTYLDTLSLGACMSVRARTGYSSLLPLISPRYGACSFAYGNGAGAPRLLVVG